MSEGMAPKTMRRKSSEDLARPLPLESVASVPQGGSATEVVALSNHGLISRERLRHIYAEDLAVLMAEAREAGLEEGREQAALEAAAASTRESEARRRVEELAAEELREKLGQLDGVIGALQSQRGAVLHDAEEAIVELMYACLTHLLGRLAVEGDLIQALVSKALEDIPASEPLTVRLSLGDHAALAECGGLDRMVEGRVTRFIADAKLRTGDCMIESARGTLDCGLERQLSGLRDVLIAVAQREEGRHARQAG